MPISRILLNFVYQSTNNNTQHTMKKLFLLLALMGMVVVGCSKDEVDKGNDNKTEQPNENDGGNDNDIPVNIFFGLDKESITISPDGGSVDVVVYSNYKWEISGTSDWCTPSVKKGDANEDGQIVTFSADMTYDDREATFWFRCADERIKFVVTQKLKAVLIPDANNTFNIPSEGGVAVISYQTSVDCEVIIPKYAQSWITIAPATRGLVSENINLDIAENTTYDSRSAVIKVVAKNNAELVVEYTINQAQNNAILADENNVFTVPSAGGEVVIQYQTNVDCEVVIPEEAQDWITIAPATRGLVSENINLDIAENTTYDSRSAVIKVVAKDNAELVVEYTINQVQNDAILADENNVFTVPSAGGEVVIQYQTNVDCEVVIPEEAQDWITIAPATRGLVSENINLDIAENTTYDSRSAVIKVVAKDNAELIVEYTINQVQKNAIFADENNVFTVPGPGGEVVIKYQTNVDCEVIIPEEAQDWITIVPETRGLVAYNTTLNIAANNSGELRSSVIKVVSQEDNELFAEYTITQNPRYSLYYTSSDGNIVQPYSSSVFGATILSNTYKDGVGIIEFNAPITKIGDWAFYDCSNLTSVTIPDRVTKIGSYAFKTCINLTSITIPDSVTTIGYAAFSGCSSLTSVTIPDSVTTIGDYAFYNCSSLTSVYISDLSAWCRISFERADANPLCYVANLYLNNELVTDLVIPSDITEIKNYAFFNCSSLTSVTIPDSVTTIGDGAFYDCSSLTSVTIPNSVTTIGNEAFYGCTGELVVNCNIPSASRPWYSAFYGSKFTTVTIGGSVTTIGDYAFTGYSSLTSVTIGDSVTTIGYRAFYCCTGELVINCNIPSASSGANGAFYGSKFTTVTIADGVTTIGDCAFEGCSSLTSATIPDSVRYIRYAAFFGCSSLTSVTIPDSVTTIGDGAFAYCSSLTSITIPDSVTTIGRDAFSGCSSLTSVTIPDCVTTIGHYAFNDCSSLTSVTIPDSVTTIGDGAFSGCSSLTSVTIPDSVTEIGSDAFSGCSSLTSITIPDSVTTIGNEAFYGCTGELVVNCYIPSALNPKYGKFYGSKFTTVTIADGVTTIGDYAFSGCSSLTSVTIPDSVTTIGKYAFSGCTGELVVNCNIPSVSSSEYGKFYGSKFTSVTIGDSVTTIGDYAFSGCSSLTSVTIGDSVTTIGNEAFYGCTGELVINCNIPSASSDSSGAFYGSKFTSVTIGDSVTTIGKYAFYSCDSLTSVYISDLSAWCKINFEGSDANPLYYAGNLYLKNELVTDLVIPSDITEIKFGAFYNCSSLTSVTIPDSVTTIGKSAFNGCCSLTSITIPDSVTTIGVQAFKDCSSLTSVTIPDSITTIEDRAFVYCSSLTSITIPDSVTTIGYAAFSDCSSLTSVTIPDSVTTIRGSAFRSCTRLTSVYCKAVTPPAGGASMFSSNASGRKIYVPMKSVEAYKSAEGWSDYKSSIVGYNF